MEKVDVAVCSYKKPESLIYTLFCIKEYCGNIIDTVYIHDDYSNDGTIDFYKDEKFLEAIAPIKIKIRENKKHFGAFKTISTPKLQELVATQKSLIIDGPETILSDDENDVRYQWAINSTDKKYLFIVHDDIKISDNIVELYLKTIQGNQNMAIVGDLGQCYRCFDSSKCNPEFIMQGNRPHGYWPLTTYELIPYPRAFKRDCRINEWCCMINVEIARKLSIENNCYFGNCENGGDTGVYWFDKIVELGYDFADPIPKGEDRIRYYQHMWQGYSGNSVWLGLSVYARDMIKDTLKKEFNYILNY